MRHICLFLIAFLLTTIGCSPVKSSVEQGGSTDEVLMLAYSLTWDSAGQQIHVGILNQLRAPGSFRIPDTLSPAFDDDLVVSFSNNKGRTIHRETIRNPLFRQVEAVNDSGRLMRVTSVEKRGEAVLRTRFDRRMDGVRITTRGEPGKIIFEHKITKQ